MTDNPPKRFAPETAEEAAGILTGYRFARPFVEGKSVAELNWEEIGFGARLLARDAKQVASLTGSPDHLESARKYYPAENIRYGVVDFLELPYPDGHFDTVVAFALIENLESPGRFLAEAKRVLKKDGTLLISTPDKQLHSNERGRQTSSARREFYAPELREMLERRFERVSLYRQGVVSGGVIFEEGADLRGASIESARFAHTDPAFGSGVPEADIVLAVCGDGEAPVGGGPRLLLDRDRRMLDENEDQREDIAELRDEILHMRQTEIQSFQDATNYYNGGFIIMLARSGLVYRVENSLPGRLAWLALKATRRAYRTMREKNPGGG